MSGRRPQNVAGPHHAIWMDLVTRQASMPSGPSSEPWPLSFTPWNGLTDIDAALAQQVLDVAQRKRVLNVYHHRWSDHLWVTHGSRDTDWQRRTLPQNIRPLPFQPVYFDTVVSPFTFTAGHRRPRR